MTVIFVTYKMELKRLHSDVIEKTRSSFTINTVCQCVLELVLNSLDAKATAIAIRINLVTLRIQVVDNGEGILKNNLKLIGLRYFTNKCDNLKSLEKQIKSYGFRGEALANITELSKSVNITSKHISSSETCSATLGKITVVKNRPSVGTTVTVEGLFHNFPVRKKRIVNELELDEIKKNVRSLIIIHHGVTFSLRDDIGGELVLSSRKTDDIPSAFKFLHPESEKGTFMKITKSKTSINALLFKTVAENNKMQYIYVNKRPIYSIKIQKLITKLFYKNSNYRRNRLGNTKIFPIYMINIKCPYSDVDILLNPSKTMVQFKNWHRIEQCIEKLFNSFFGKNHPQKKPKTTEPEKKEVNLNPNCGISQIGGVVRAYGYKRKNNDQSSEPQKKLIKVDEMSLSKKSILKEQNAMINESCDIIESSLHKEETKHFKQPLPIIIAPMDKQKFTQSVDLSIKPPTEEDTLSKFNNDENKGKNFILDMFLKSTQVYKSDENIQNSTQGSGETVYEEESNLRVENNIQTKINGQSKTMSLSLNLKSTKKIKRHKKVMREKCIQTTLDKRMISKGLQTTLKEKSVIRDEEEEHLLPEHYTLLYTNTKKSRFKFVYKKPEQSKNFDFTYTQNCNCDCHGKAIFNFGKEDSKQTDLPHKHTKLLNTQNCTNRKLHKRIDKHEVNIFGNKNREFVKKNNLYFPERDYRKIRREGYKNKNMFTDILNQCIELASDNTSSLIQKNPNTNKYIPMWSIKKKLNHNNNHNLLDQSPYFKPKTQTIHYAFTKPNYLTTTYNHKHCLPVENLHYNMNTCLDINKNSYGQFKPPYESTRENQYLEQNYPIRGNNKEDILLDTLTQFQSKQMKTKKHENWNVTIGSFGKFKPFHKSTQQSQVLEKNDLNKDCINKQKHGDSNFFSFGKPCEVSTADTRTRPEDINLNLNKNTEDPAVNLSILEVTMSETENLNLFERELGAERSILMKEFLEWNSQFSQDNPKKAENECNWTKRDNLGSCYYINKNTGYATSKTPKPNNVFAFFKRYEFLPKGMSPILKEVKNVDQSLSQNGKNTLFEYILETYKDDLVYVKWQHYLKDSDQKNFFDNMYKEKLKMYDTCVPNISTVNQKQDIINLNRGLFENLEIVGQLDKKFIIVRDTKENMLIVFDQHAVHERIRLEKLIKIYKNAKSACKEKLIFFIPQNELSLLRRHESYLNYLGMMVEFFDEGIYITEVPLCLYLKFKEKDSTKSLNELVHVLINEIIDLLKSTRGVSLKIFPKLIQNVINLEACRGAIKFGDSLNHRQCLDLLQKLSTTDLPFQCAHGRPTVTPLLRLSSNSIRSTANGKVNFKILKKTK